MADLFRVTAPLVVRSPPGQQRIMAEVWPHSRGIVYFEPFWHLAETTATIHVIEGELKGAGPWKVGDHIIRVLGCRGVDPELALLLAQWQEYLAGCGGQYIERGELERVARQYGAEI